MKRKQTGWVTLSPLFRRGEESMDVIVPDVQPDVFSVISAEAFCSVQEVRTTAERVELAGTAEVQVLYTAEDEHVFAMHGSIPLRHSFAVSGCDEDCVTQLSACAVHASASVLNPRKLSLRAEIVEEGCVRRRCDYELCEDFRAGPEEGVQTLHEEHRRVVLGGVAQRTLEFSEELRLHGAAAEGGMLAHSAAEWQIEEARALERRIAVRGTVNVTAATVTNEGAFAGTCTYALPFSQTLDCADALPDDTVEVQMAARTAEYRLYEEDGGRRLELRLAGELTACLWRDETLSPIVDLYSTRYELSYESEPLPGENRPEPQELRAALRENVECGAVAEVCDWSWRACAERAGEGVQGRYWFRVLCRMADGGLKTVCRRLDWRPEGTEGLCACRCLAENVRVMPSAEGLSIELTAVCCGCRSCGCGGRQVSACRLDVQTPRSRPEPGTLLLRAAGEQESLWAVAKQYGVPSAQLAAANKLPSDGALTPGQLVIIPFAN